MNRKHIVVMRKSTGFMLIIIAFAAVIITGIYYIAEKNKSAAAFSYSNNSKEELYKDFIISLLDQDIRKAVENYYGKSKEFVYEDVYGIKRTGENYNCFEITVKVATKYDENAVSYGLDTITMSKNLNGIILKDFSHKEIVMFDRNN